MLIDCSSAGFLPSLPCLPRGIRAGYMDGRMDGGDNANLFIALLLPLRYQIRIRVAVLQEPVVQLFRDGFFFVV